MSEVDSALLAAPNGADFLIARANMIGSISPGPIFVRTLGCTP